MTTHWNAFLPIPTALRSDEVGLDPSWAAAMGVDKDALAVLRCIRLDVLPLVRDLERRDVLKSFSFLIHDRASGVPCPPEDYSAYIHLRLALLSGVRRATKVLPRQWVYVSQVKPSPDELQVQELLDEQSAWYFRFVERFSNLSDVDLLLHVGKHLHYFANMSHMMVR